MQRGIVIGHATSTVKHASLANWRLAIVQLIDAAGRPEADPLVAIDRHGAAAGQKVLLGHDGRGAREYVGCEKSPVRWFVAGLIDAENATCG